MTTPPAPTSSGWAVTGQTETTRVDDAGQTVRGVVVYFRTGAGQTSSVFVPGNLYPDQVQAMVAAKAAQVDAVANLSAPATGGM